MVIFPQYIHTSASIVPLFYTLLFCLKQATVESVTH